MTTRMHPTPRWMLIFIKVSRTAQRIEEEEEEEAASGPIVLSVIFASRRAPHSSCLGVAFYQLFALQDKYTQIPPLRGVRVLPVSVCVGKMRGGHSAQQENYANAAGDAGRDILKRFRAITLDGLGIGLWPPRRLLSSQT